MKENLHLPEPVLVIGPSRLLSGETPDSDEIWGSMVSMLRDDREVEQVFEMPEDLPGTIEERDCRVIVHPSSFIGSERAAVQLEKALAKGQRVVVAEHRVPVDPLGWDNLARNLHMRGASVVKSDMCFFDNVFNALDRIL